MKKICFVLIALLFFIVDVKAQNIDLRFLSDNNVGKEFMSKNSLKSYHILYQQFFVTNEKVDFKKLEQLLNKNFPNKNQQGMLVLDWEDKAIDHLAKQSNKSKFLFYESEFVKALKYIKSKRPNVKIGFYAIPFRNYWNINDDFYTKNDNLKTIIKYQDFIAPSLYVFYIDSKDKISNLNYINKNLEYALKIGKELNKPVYPFIWHRVHPSNAAAGDKLVPLDVFKETIKNITNVEYQGRKVQGLFWWHSESFSYQNRKKYKKYDLEYKNVVDVDSYQKKIFQQYYNVMKEYL